MLIEFRVANYRSICEEQVISLVPASTGQSDFPDNIIAGKYSALNGLALYGANSSGKSNLLKSIELLDRLLYTSAKMSSTANLPYDPNLLKEGYASKPTVLEVSLEIEGIRYRYGLEYNRSEVLTEWLFRKKTGREVELFFRDKEIIEVSSGFGGSPKTISTAIEITRPNGLFLSFCDMVNVTEAKTLFQWFDKLVYVDGLDTPREELKTITLLENEEFGKRIKGYLSSLGLGFEDIALQKKEFDPNNLPTNIDEELKQSIIQGLKGSKEVRVNTSHSTYDKRGSRTGEVIFWSMNERESEGTKKAFHVSGQVLFTLLKGGVLVIDEIEAKMHPILTRHIINLFFSKETNPLNAQIIFASHDTNLLNSLNLRRDQINLVEKNAWESSEIFALSDIKYFDGQKERHDTNKEKRYLEGRYGAVPILRESHEYLENSYGKKRTD